MIFQSIVIPMKGGIQGFDWRLDSESDIDSVDLSTGMEELKKRLEVLLGQKPDTPEDERTG